jgi:hypothetical protein
MCGSSTAIVENVVEYVTQIFERDCFHFDSFAIASTIKIIATLRKA